MQRLRSIAAAISIAFLGSTAVTAQQTWTVATPAELTAAIAAAAPGDIIQLAPGGFFDDFTLDKGLTLKGPGTIGGNYALFGARIVTVPAGQMARFIEVDFRTHPIPVSPSQGSVRVTGAARFDDCRIVGARTAALDLQDADVVLQRCTVMGKEGAAGIVAIDSHLSITDSTVRGANRLDAIFFSTEARPGIDCSGQGSLHATTSEVWGGDGWFTLTGAGGPPANGIDSLVPTWLSDAKVRGGSARTGPDPSPFDGGIALNAAQASVARCALIGGLGATNGWQFAGDVVDDRTLLGVSASGLRIGAAFDLRCFADRPGVGIAVLASSAIDAPLTSPLFVQPQWLAAIPFFVAAGTTDGNHEFGLSFAVPLVPGLRNQSFDFVGYRLSDAGYQSTPVAGGIVN